jgi:hypothetical protein
MTASIADGTGGPWLLGSLSTQNDNCSGDLDTIQNASNRSSAVRVRKAGIADANSLGNFTIRIL